MKDKDLDKYYKMLTYMRPASSRTENRYIKRFIDSVTGMEKDTYGNRYIVVGEESPTTMFSSHTDTMHNQHGRQKILIDEFTSAVFADGSNCLGADDTTGNFIMLHMINKKIPGLYVFHRAEEIGGLGSDYFSRNMVYQFPDLERCIAFDRKADYSVITHQYGKCCSQEFAEALADQLKTKKRGWKPDDTGLFTDSANYVDVISECTNLSVGYYNEHTKHEYQDIDFLKVFMDKILTVDWDALPTLRDLDDQFDWWEGNYDYGDDPYASTTGYNNVSSITRSVCENPNDGIGVDGTGSWNNTQAYEDICDIVYKDPERAVILLCEYYGVNKYDERLM